MLYIDSETLINIRFECLRLAVSALNADATQEDVVAVAGDFEKFILGVANV